MSAICIIDTSILLVNFNRSQFKSSGRFFKINHHPVGAVAQNILQKSLVCRGKAHYN